MDIKSKQRIWVYIVFISILLIRLPYITNPPLDYSSWRQVDTDSIARNFVENDFNIFLPQLNYDGPMPNYVQLEFQVTTFIIAVLYKIFGYKPVFGRIVPIAFFMGSCYYLFLLVKGKSGIKVGIFTVLIYGLLPVNVIYSRNIMPESALMFFSIGAIYYFDMWIDRDKIKFYILSIIFTTLAISTKVPSAIIGIPMIYLYFKKHGWKAFRNKYIYLFPVIVLGLPYLYFTYLGKVAEQKFVTGICDDMVLPNMFNSLFKEDTLKYLNKQFVDKIFTIPGFILFSIGLFLKKDKTENFYYLWLLGGFLHVVLIDSVIHLDYYLMIITPIISIFIGHSMAWLFSRYRVRYFVYIALILIVILNGQFFEEAYSVQYKYIYMGNNVSMYTEKDALLIVDSDSPEMLYTCDRKGWRLYRELLTVDNIKKLIDEGADYFIPSSLTVDENISYYLETNFKRIDFRDGYYIYELSKPGIFQY